MLEWLCFLLLADLDLLFALINSLYKFHTPQPSTNGPARIKDGLLFQFLTYFRVCLHCAVGILLGLFYYGIGSDAAYVFDNFNLLFFSLMFLMYTALSSMLISCKYLQLRLKVLFTPLT